MSMSNQKTTCIHNMAQPNYPPLPTFPSLSPPTTGGEPETQTDQTPPLGYPPPNYPTAPPPGGQAIYANAPMAQSTYPPPPPPPLQDQIYPNYPPPPPPLQDQIYPPPQLQQHIYPPVSYSPPAQPSYSPSTPVNHQPITKPLPLPVLGPQYCVTHIIDLAIVRKLMTVTDDFVVTDVNKNLMFKVKGKFLSLHDKRVLLDAAGNPLITLRQKILSAHSRWQAFRGDSKDPRDLIFTAKTSSAIQLKTKLNVYLPNTSTEDVSDFKVEGSWSERSCVIYVGESTTIAAQMHKKDTAGSYFLGKDTFMVTVYPNIDYAFVIALVVILDAINSGDLP